MSNIVRPEYPRPQLAREDWINLNGEWEFEVDRSVSGKARKIQEAEHLADRILVPFCPESQLSGVNYKDFMNCVWYLRRLELPEEWKVGAFEKGERVILHFGAVDYFATVYINGREVGSHKGGYASFSMDITDRLDRSGENILTVCAEDDVRSGRQPGGKQSMVYASEGCYYTRTTGIWQTVWLEKVPAAHIKSIRIYPDVENTRVRITAQVAGSGTLKVQAFYEGRKMGLGSACVGCGTRAAAGKPEESVEGSRGERASEGVADVVLDLKEEHLWEPGAGRLYDLTLSFGEDQVTSYFGLRSVRMEGMRFLLNGKSVFQRLVLDQGFYPDGIYTAPCEEALIRDIKLSMAAGFNGARLHQKAFEPRFLYHCDRLGYLVWGEHANWDLDVSDYAALHVFLPEWMEILERDFNHPAIVGWCPWNETWDVEGRRQRDENLAVTYLVTKQMDPTRPCIDTSGNYHVMTDIFDLHDYDQNAETFRRRYQRFTRENVLEDNHGSRQTYGGQPIFISEYGGIKWDVDGGIPGWGYGEGPGTEEAFIERYRGLTDTLLDNEKMFGFCYTQLYDVEQEKNGLYTYDRKPKFDMEIFRRINSRRAAIEAE